MGVLATGSAHARPSARLPINICLEVFLINFLAKSENSKHFLFFLKILKVTMQTPAPKNFP